MPIYIWLARFCRIIYSSKNRLCGRVVTVTLTYLLWKKILLPGLRNHNEYIIWVYYGSWNLHAWQDANANKYCRNIITHLAQLSCLRKQLHGFHKHITFPMTRTSITCFIFLEYSVLNRIHKADKNTGKLENGHVVLLRKMVSLRIFNRINNNHVYTTKFLTRHLKHPYVDTAHANQCKTMVSNI